ncbi:MAG: hypothetical protein D4R67_04975 [Bacteroidetes bacterium]|nr:MAG: hypothetical protein D4R67_04975 [Bacteroidota bacterium]
MRTFLTWIILHCLFVSLSGQDTTRISGFQQFFYPNGQISSEGILVNGQPDGYWKSYYENGILKSEGNRTNFKLDSIWKFYNPEGKLILEITYRDGKRNGYKTSFLDRETIREYYINDSKEGFTEYYHTEGWKKLEIPFEKGLEQGIGKEYNEQGEIITITEYKKGFIVERMKINRKDKLNRKQGKWITFWENGKMKLEGTYKDDKRNGYFKEYAESGDLLQITKYIEGVLQPEAAEIQKLDIEKEYYPTGTVKATRLYRNGVLEGISVEYSPDGAIVSAKEFQGGIQIGQGLVLEDGSREGHWIEYYPGGTLKAEGDYKADKKTGKWNYFHPNGRLEQTGVYNKEGKPEGTWKWYYDSGQLLREENYYRGKKDGLSEEFDEEGILIEKGEYLDGLEDGPWFQCVGDWCQRGSYRDGLRNGLWVAYNLQIGEKGTDSLLIFKGGFLEDLPDGKHSYYWDNGKIRDEGMYVMGNKEGDWIKYNYDGTLFMIISYINGIETRFDGVRIKPPFEPEE